MPLRDVKITTSLYVYGDDLDPDIVSASLGVSPTTSRRNGEKRTTSTNQEVVQKTGLWELTAASNSDVLSDQIKDLLSKISACRGSPAKIAGVQEAYVDILICPSLDQNGRANCHFDLAKEVVAALGKLELPIQFTVGFTA
jgi:hypothetical protein